MESPDRLDVPRRAQRCPPAGPARRARAARLLRRIATDRRPLSPPNARPSVGRRARRCRRAPAPRSRSATPPSLSEAEVADRDERRGRDRVGHALRPPAARSPSRWASRHISIPERGIHTMDELESRLERRAVELGPRTARGAGGGRRPPPPGLPRARRAARSPVRRSLTTAVGTRRRGRARGRDHRTNKGTHTVQVLGTRLRARRCRRGRAVGQRSTRTARAVPLPARHSRRRWHTVAGRTRRERRARHVRTGSRSRRARQRGWSVRHSARAPPILFRTTRTMTSASSPGVRRPPTTRSSVDADFLARNHKARRRQGHVAASKDQTPVVPHRRHLRASRRRPRPAFRSRAVGRVPGRRSPVDRIDVNLDTSEPTPPTCATRSPRP